MGNGNSDRKIYRAGVACVTRAVLTTPAFFPISWAQSAREVRTESGLGSWQSLYLTLLSTPIAPNRVFTPVNSAVAVPAESGTYH